MSETEDRLYGLMEVVEQQQAAVQAALKELAAERAALQREREHLARQAEALERSTRAAVRSAVQESLAGAATEGVAAVAAAARPMLAELAEVSEKAGAAEAALRRVVQWASWRLLGWGIAALAGLVIVGWLASGATQWWDVRAITAAQTRKAELAAEIATLQANRDTWIKAGMLGKIATCGPGNRPCIRIDEKAGPFGDGGDYRIIAGY